MNSQERNLNLPRMNSLLKLKSYIGSEKTLLISSPELEIEKYAEFQDNLFVHFVNGSRLLRHDPQEREILQYYLESKSCSQLIFVGSMDRELIAQIQTDDSAFALRSALTFNLKPFLRARHERAIDADIQLQMLIELNVVKQCKFLLDYFFIKEKVAKNELQIKGVVTDFKSEYLKPIFYNGVVYNDLLTLN